MNKGRIVVVVAASALALSTGLVSLSAQTEEADRASEAAKVLQEIQGAKETTIPRAILEKARAIAVFPSTIKGAFVVGAQRGKGVISGRSNGTWSAPAFVTITGGSVGFQIGGQATDIVLVVLNDRGLENLSSNSFKIGGDASVAGGPVGREATAATDYKFQAEILSYSRSRGAFAGVSLNGSTIRADRDANKRVYGSDYTTKQIVTERKTTMPAGVAPLVAALQRIAQQ
jgi:lipid-binding SYLF domain-containing protein